VVGIVGYFRKDKVILIKLLKHGGLATSIFIAFILLSLIFAFNSVFTLFHLLFFPQGNWQFAADSLLIRTFPVEFFVKMGRGIFFLTFIFGMAVFLGSLFIKHKLWKS